MTRMTARTLGKNRSGAPYTSISADEKQPIAGAPDYSFSAEASRQILPGRFSRVSELDFLTETERLLYRQIEGHSFVNLFRFLEPFINPTGQSAVSGETALQSEPAWSPTASDYVFTANARAFKQVLLGRSNWALRGLGLIINQVAQVYHSLIEVPEPVAVEIWNGWFALPVTNPLPRHSLFESEWIREDTKLGAVSRDGVIDDLIAVVKAVDEILQKQAQTDARFFTTKCFRDFNYAEHRFIEQVFLKAYRAQFLVTGIRASRFAEVLGELTTPAQKSRIRETFTPLVTTQSH